MIRTTIVAALSLLIATPAHAQSQQDLLDQRYDRALAAGYKALFLCSALANAEANGTSRTPEHVIQWELTGIQSPFEGIVEELPYEVVRRPSGEIAYVKVEWDDTMPARLAGLFPAEGCSSLPIGTPEAWGNPDESLSGLKSEPATGGIELAENIGRRFDSIVSRAFAPTYGDGTRTSAVLLLQNGMIVSEKYADGFNAQTPQRTWSVAKSIAATIIGQASTSQTVDVNDPVGLNYWRVGGRSDARNAITIDHALRMSSGRYSDTLGNRTDPLYWGGATVDEHATNWPLINPPGSVFRYANNDTLMAIKAIGSYLDYSPPSFFFKKIGMHHTVAETDIRGGYVLSSQVWSTARDLARLGQLHLDDGVLPDGGRILPEGWVEYVSSPSGPQPEGRGIGYGAGWWLLNQSEGIPPDTFAAMGNRGQYVVIVPSMDVVIVRRGEDPAGSRFNIIDFTRDVLTALDR